MFYFLSGCYVVLNLVTVLVLRSLKGITIVKVTRPLDIPERLKSSGILHVVAW
jgi:hypothetical protein